MGSFRFGTENTPIIKALFRFVSISLPLLVFATGIVLTLRTREGGLSSSVPEFIDLRFRENKPKTLVFSH